MLSLLRHKLGALLVRWGRRLEDQDDAVPQPGAMMPGQAASPPEHWLRLVRERAPQLLESSGHGHALSFSSAQLRNRPKNALPACGQEQAFEELPRACGPFHAPDGQQSRSGSGPEAGDVAGSPAPSEGRGGWRFSVRPWTRKGSAESAGRGRQNQGLSSQCAPGEAAGGGDRLFRSDSAGPDGPLPSKNAAVRPAEPQEAAGRQDAGLRRRNVPSLRRDPGTADQGGPRAVSVDGQGMPDELSTRKAEPSEPPWSVGRSSGPERAAASPAQEPSEPEGRASGLASREQAHDCGPSKRALPSCLLHFDRKRKECDALNPPSDEGRTGRAGAGEAPAATEGTERAAWTSPWLGHGQAREAGDWACKNAQPSDAWNVRKSHDRAKAFEPLPETADSCLAGCCSADAAGAWPSLKDERLSKPQPCVDAACSAISWPLLPSEEQRSPEAFEPLLLPPEQHFSARKQQELLGTLWNA